MTSDKTSWTQPVRIHHLVLYNLSYSETKMFPVSITLRLNRGWDLKFQFKTLLESELVICFIHSAERQNHMSTSAHIF